MLNMNQTTLFHRGYSAGGGKHNQARSTFQVALIRVTSTGTNRS